MKTRNWALIIIVAGIIFFVSGVYGLARHFSLILAGLGILFMLCGATILSLAARPWCLSAPHPYVIGITIAAIGLHLYEQVYESANDPSMGYLLWSMVPYALCLALSSFAGIRTSAIAATVIALAFDVWGYYTVFINPQSSTAPLVLLFIPLWSTVIFIPLVTFISWSITKKRNPRKVAT